jgi:DNA-directed RNA polymerase specialized sigma24 family protein
MASTELFAGAGLDSHRVFPDESPHVPARLSNCPASFILWMSRSTRGIETTGWRDVFMLIFEDATRRTIRGIVCRITMDKTLQEDLVQEALIHLWRLESERPGQTRSWYFQNCKYAVLNILKTGRSVDALKHSADRISIYDLGEVDGELHRIEVADESPVDYVSARDIFNEIDARLGHAERVVLDCLALGMGSRETANHIGTSHPTVIRRRRKIAATAKRLGIAPPQRWRRRPNSQPLKTPTPSVAI